MSDFKVGDRVKVIEGGYATYGVGDTGTVTYITSGSITQLAMDRVRDNTPKALFYEEDLELLTEEETITVKVSDLPELDESDLTGGVFTLEYVRELALYYLAQERRILKEKANEGELDAKRSAWAEKLTISGARNYNLLTTPAKRAVDILIENGVSPE